jgi:uncharacterized membrane protein YraQ (UPF0718 family)
MEYVVFTLIIIFLIGIYIIFNLLKKVEKLEKSNIEQEQFILELYNLIKFSEEKIKEIDSNQLFQSDDDVGFFFTNLKNLQNMLSEYIKFVK